MSIRERIFGSIWGLAVGNVLGLGIEGMSRTSAQLCHFERVGMPVGEALAPWDDDLAMAVELGEWALTQAPDLDALADRYLIWFQENGRGIGGLTRRVLERMAKGDARAAERVWEEDHRRYGRHPQGNGSVMRAPAVAWGLFASPHQVPTVARLDAGLTHWDPLCREASGLVAAMTAGFLLGEDDPEAWALAHMEAKLSKPLKSALAGRGLEAIEEEGIDGENAGHALLTLEVAASVLRSGMSFREGVAWTLRQGGDTDTNGAVVGALLGARDGLKAIPPEWRACVSNRGRLEALGEVCISNSQLVVTDGLD